MSSQELKADESGLRLDSFLAARLKLPRSHVKKMILEGRVLVDGRLVEAGSRLKDGSLVAVSSGERSWLNEIRPVFGSGVIWEDSDLLIFDKPPGLLTHPKSPGWLEKPELAAEDQEANLAGLLYLERPSLRLVPRLGIAHRLDRGTSGVMAVAKTRESLSILMAAFKARTVLKVYRAIVKGSPKSSHATIEAPVGRRTGQGRITADPLGKPALTEMRVLKRTSRAALVEARPKTGRTHQIRAHLALWGHPVLGDPDFAPADRRQGSVPLPPRPLLHAYELAFEHPLRGKPLRFRAPLPKDFKAYWSALQLIREKPRS